MNPLRFAMAGAGFWSNYQLAAWNELDDIHCVAVVDRVPDKAEALASKYGVAKVYDDAEEMCRCEDLDFMDVVTDVDSHPTIAAIGIAHELAVICQKPMAASLDIAQRMVQSANDAKLPFLIHENWRWQRPLRRLKQILESGRLGQLVRARIDYANSFPVFDNQPFLKELDQFILTDIGTHILDVARFLFGEARTLYCQTRKMHEQIAGEDVATVVMEMSDALTVTCNLSYASRWEFDHFPETFVAVEGTKAGASLGAQYSIRIFGDGCEHNEVAAPKVYSWADPDYMLIHSSIVDCHRHLVSALRGNVVAETTAEDNLRTLELVFAAYRSASSHRVVTLEDLC